MVRLAILLLFLSSCSCDWHLKKARQKCNISQLSDTLFISDTTYVDRVKKDTLFYYNQKDTVIIREGRLTMKYFYNDSTVYLSGTCDTIKVIKEVPVIVNNTELKGSNLFNDIIKGLALAIILFFIFKMYILTK